MEIFPAIDIMDGKVVRLFQGNYQNRETYGDDPAAFAKQFKAQGAKYLHLVDLDGAKAGSPKNKDIIKKVARESGLLCELGGGIRDEDTVSTYLEAGVGRVILGTAALRDPAFTRRMVERYGDKIAVGVDARDGKVAVEGWLDTSDTDSLQFCRTMRDIGVSYIIYTDISRDGAQKGANLKVYRALAEIKGLNITASGGVSSLEDIRGLREMGLYAAILGKALYTGTLDLTAALSAAKGEE